MTLMGFQWSSHVTASQGQEFEALGEKLTGRGSLRGAEPCWKTPWLTKKQVFRLRVSPKCVLFLKNVRIFLKLQLRARAMAQHPWNLIAGGCSHRNCYQDAKGHTCPSLRWQEKRRDDWKVPERQFLVMPDPIPSAAFLFVSQVSIVGW